MYHCKITTIEKDALSRLWSLEILNLSHNLISDFPDELESGYLEYLYLDNNR